LVLGISLDLELGFWNFYLPTHHYVARKTGYIGYIVDNQELNRLQNQLHTGYTSYTIDNQQVMSA
jgi:hypothetical protein